MMDGHVSGDATETASLDDLEIEVQHLATSRANTSVSMEGTMDTLLKEMRDLEAAAAQSAEAEAAATSRPCICVPVWLDPSPPLALPPSVAVIASLVKPAVGSTPITARRVSRDQILHHRPVECCAAATGHTLL